MTLPYTLFKKCSVLLFFAFLLSSLFSASFATPLIVDNGTSGSINLSAHYQVFIDESHAVTIDDILAAAHSSQFKPLSKNIADFGFRNESFWFKVEISNALKTNSKQLLEFKSPLLDALDVYLVHGLSKRIIAQQQLGDLQDFASRPYPHTNFVMPITLPAQSNVTLYFRINSTSPVSANATLWQSEIFPHHSQTHFLWISLCAGILLTLLCYNFLLFISLRNISYLYYTLLSSAILLTLGSFNGLWFELLWPMSPQWHNTSLPIGLTLAGLFSAQFSRSFLSTASTSPKLNTAFNRLSLAFIATLIASLIIPLSYVSYIIILLGLMLCFTALTASVPSSLQGDRGSQIHFMAWLVALLGIVFFIVGTNVDYSFILSGIFYVLLLSFALAYRIIITHKQTEKFHQKMVAENEVKLTQQVGERTQELTSLNEKLYRQEGVLKKLAFYDSLTGLANSTFATEQLEYLLAQTKRNKTKVAVLFIDLNDFKPVNDKYGNKVGDEVLVIIADRLRATLRENDVVGRLGCDKFIVLMESVHGDAHDPDEVANKIKATISQAISMDWFTLHLDASIGIARYPNDGSDAESLILAADSAMFANKSAKEDPKPQ